MFFQVSPVKKRKPVVKPIATVEEDIAVLTLKPFSSIPKLSFQDVLVNGTYINRVQVINPKANAAQVYAFFDGPEDLPVSLSWCEKSLEGNAHCILEIFWSPKMEYSSRHSIRITCEKHCWNIPIGFKSVLPKVSKQKSRPKLTTTLVKKTSPILKLNGRKITRVTRTVIEEKAVWKDIVPFPHSTPSFKESINTNSTCDSFVSPTNVTFNIKSVDNVRRFTYAIEKIDKKQKHVSPKFDDSLEVDTANSSSSPNKERTVLKDISKQNTPTIEELLLRELGDHSLIKTPVGQAFRPRRSSTEIVKKGYQDSNFLGDSHLVRNFSSELSMATPNILVTSPENIEKGSCLMNLSSKTYTIGEENLTNESFDFEPSRNCMKTFDVENERNRVNTQSQSVFKHPKRKSDCTFSFSPEKRANLSPQTWSKHNGSNVKFVTSTNDPFLSTSISFNQEWMDQHEERFKKWFNMLLTPPSEFNIAEVQNIDAAKIWRECSKNEVAAAPTKEEVCEQYHTFSKLDALRKSSKILHGTEDIQIVLKKISSAIDVGKIEIRPDRQVHLDLSLQSKIMNLLLSYNPLWLRIGLETVYQEKLMLKSNSDILGLSRFLYDRFFRDPALLRKCKTVHSPKYSSEIKKFILKRYLHLVYFLDNAKLQKLIVHDPCLFRRNAPVKDSRAMLVNFALEAITAAIGDITKYFKHFGYVLFHKQLYIHEFDYAVNNLGGDLRDGVRLTRVMEIILLRDGLIENLRVPAISRLQKIHNVKLVFNALLEAGCEIQNNIEPFHIVDGHREKTLSFLWQLIYKIHTPLMIKNARKIQIWWRSLSITLKRIELRKTYNKKLEASVKIQGWFRNQILAKKIQAISIFLTKHLQQLRRDRAAAKIQTFFRMFIARKKYIITKQSIVKLQRTCRKWLQGSYHKKRTEASIIIQKNIRQFLARTRFVKLKNTVLTIENIYFAKKLMIAQRRHYQRIKFSVLVIEKRYEATKLMKIERTNFTKTKTAVVFVQQKIRAKTSMRICRQQFLTLRQSCIEIQRRFRANILMKNEMSKFTNLKKAVISIQTVYRASKLMGIQREIFQTLKKNVIICQRRYRANQLMKTQRASYLLQRRSVLVIQEHFRNYLKMKRERNSYLTWKRTACIIQQRFRANRSMKVEKERYLKIKEAVNVLQKHWKNYLVMKKTREDFLQVRKNTIIIQKWYKLIKQTIFFKKQYEATRKAAILFQSKFRSIRLMKIQRETFLKQKRSCIIIQRYFRGYLLMKNDREQYCRMKQAANLLQEKFRANRSMKTCKKEYMELQKSTLLVQRIFRANLLMKKERRTYLQYKTSTIKIQRFFRGFLLMRKERESFLRLKHCVKFVQSEYRAKKYMQICREYYLKLKTTTIFIQNIYRANYLMKAERKKFLLLKNAAIKIQEFYRNYILMTSDKTYYTELKMSVRIVQAKYRANKATVHCRTRYLQLKNAAISIQRRFRANKLMKTQRLIYLTHRKAAFTIQAFFRGYMMMKKDHRNYCLMKLAVKTIQEKYRAKLIMITCRERYVELKRITIYVQRKFIANKLMKKERSAYLSKKNATIKIQQFFKGYMLMKRERQYYLKLKTSVEFIQAKYRAKISMKLCHQDYLKMRKAAIFTQRLYRSNKLMKVERNNYLRLKATLRIQRFLRGYLLMKNEREQFQKLKNTTKFIEERYRAKISMRCCREVYLKLQKATLFVQGYYRANKLMKIQRASYLEKKEATLKIQKFFRGYLLMKNDRSKLISQLKAVGCLQKFGRGYVIRKKYGPMLTPEAIANRRMEKNREVAATRIQAYWRGFSRRSRDGDELNNLRLRVLKATNDAQPQNSLESRSERALELLENETFGMIILALKDIEYVTRRSEVICKNKGPILAGQLYYFIAVLGRSIPEIEICDLSALILINLCKYPPTTSSTWVPEHLESVLRIMLHLCDKEETPFPNLCTLLWLFAHNKNYKKVILDIPNLKTKLSKIHELVLRKQKMVVNSSRKLITSKFYPFKNLPLPGLRPDWGFDYPHRPRAFTNCVFAIESLISILKRA